MGHNTKRQVLFINEPHPILAQRLMDAGFICHFHYQTPRAELIPILDSYYGIVIRSRIKLDADFLQHATHLKFIGRLGVGIEHIDLAYAAERDIDVLITPEGSRDTVGEHTVGLMLCLMNHLNRADREVRAGEWIRGGNRGTEIKGKTVGIIGYGNMGQALAKRLQGFGARLIAYDKFKTNYADELVEEVSLEEVQATSDIVSLHIPYMPENHHWVNKDWLEAFAKPIFLINTARGLVVKTDDLVAQLQKGNVLGAALDVIEYEEQSFAHLKPDDLPEPFQYLRQAKNVVLNPHIAGWSHESLKGHAVVLADKIIKGYAG